MSDILALSDALSRQLSSYCATKYHAVEHVPWSFCVSQVLQLLSRYPNGVTEAILLSESQSAYDEYRLLFSGSSRKQLLVRDLAVSMDRDNIGVRAVLDVVVVSVEAVPTLLMTVRDYDARGATTVAKPDGGVGDADETDDLDDLVGPSRRANSVRSRLLPCYIHRSFNAYLAPTAALATAVAGTGISTSKAPSAHLITAGRRIRITNCTFSRAIDRSVTGGRRGMSTTTRVQLLPTPHMTLVLQPLRSAVDRDFLLTFSRHAIHTQVTFGYCAWRTRVRVCCSHGLLGCISRAWCVSVCFASERHAHLPARLRTHAQYVQLADILQAAADLDMFDGAGPASQLPESTLHENEYRELPRLMVKVLRCVCARVCVWSQSWLTVIIVLCMLAACSESC
jgi:hypothetical protein